MWQGYWSKEIIFLTVVILNSRIDFTDARIPRNVENTKMWITAPAHMMRGIKIRRNQFPDNINSSELLTAADVDERNHTTQSDRSQWEKFWGSVVEIFNPVPEEPKQQITDENVLTVCFAIATTYMGALRDLRRYFSLKYFYANNFHYEVGYMTSEIINKYQRMLEIYYIAQTYYFENQIKNFAPPSYMLYLYTNVLEMSTVIAHQCNMLEELEGKFKVVPDSGFGDYHMAGKDTEQNGTAEYEKVLRNYERKLMAEKKRRERERRKLRQKNLYAGFKPTTPQRKPSKGRHFPLSYGWSVEFF